MAAQQKRQREERVNDFFEDLEKEAKEYEVAEASKEQMEAVADLLSCVEKGVSGDVSDSLARIQACLTRRAWNDVQVGDSFLGFDFHADGRGAKNLKMVSGTSMSALRVEDFHAGDDMDWTIDARVISIMPPSEDGEANFFDGQLIRFQKMKGDVVTPDGRLLDRVNRVVAEIEEIESEKGAESERGENAAQILRDQREKDLEEREGRERAAKKQRLERQRTLALGRQGEEEIEKETMTEVQREAVRVVTEMQAERAMTGLGSPGLGSPTQAAVLGRNQGKCLNDVVYTVPLGGAAAAINKLQVVLRCWGPELVERMFPNFKWDMAHFFHLVVTQGREASSTRSTTNVCNLVEDESPKFANAMELVSYPFYKNGYGENVEALLGGEMTISDNSVLGLLTFAENQHDRNWAPDKGASWSGKQVVMRCICVFCHVCGVFLIVGLEEDLKELIDDLKSRGSVFRFVSDEVTAREVWSTLATAISDVKMSKTVDLVNSRGEVVKGGNKLGTVALVKTRIRQLVKELMTFAKTGPEEWKIDNYRETMDPFKSGGWKGAGGGSGKQVSSRPKGMHICFHKLGELLKVEKADGRGEFKCNRTVATCKNWHPKLEELTKADVAEFRKDKTIPKVVLAAVIALNI